jgi:hypothetical protein
VLWRSREREHITLYTPREVRGVYDVEGTHKVLVTSAVRGADYARYPRQFRGIRVYTREQTLAGAMRTALAKGLVADTDQQRMQSELDRFFTGSPLMRQVDACNDLDIQMTRDTIVLDVAARTLKPEDYLPRDWRGKIDLLTTPQGDRILRVFQTARGADIDTEGRLTVGKSAFSAGMEPCLLFPESTRANRLLSARTAMQHREVLIEAEQPVVAHHRYRRGTLYGVNLLTAVMAHPEGYADCVVISPAAARRLACYRFGILRVQDTLDLTPCVSMGDRLSVGDPLVTVHTDPEETVRVRDSRYTEVFSVEHRVSRVGRTQGQAVKVTAFGGCEFTSGSKIVTRGGVKAIAIIRDLPCTYDGRPIDCVIHPKSILDRRCQGTLREMALARKCLAEGREHLAVKHFDDKYTVPELAAGGWTDYTQLETGESVFVGPLFWVRTDKHAQDGLSYTAGERPTDFRGLVMDSGKLGGQRLGLDTEMALRAKGMQDAAEALTAANREPTAVDMTARLANVLLHSTEAR